MQLRPRNEQCPARPPGLYHATDARLTCMECGAMTVLYSEPPTPVVRLVATVPPCEVCGKPSEDRRAWGAALCADCRFMRRAMFVRLRFEQGSLTESGAMEPIVPGGRVHAGSGSLDDWEAATIQLAVGPKK